MSYGSSSSARSNVASRSSAIVSMSALGCPSRANPFKSGVFPFFHFASSLVAEALNAVNSAWPKMVSLIDSGELIVDSAELGVDAFNCPLSTFNCE